MAKAQDYQAALEIAGKTYQYYSIAKACTEAGVDIASLPVSMKILLENLLRFYDQNSESSLDVAALFAWLKTKMSEREIAYRPARVLMQDFTGVPAVVDLAAMRDAVKKLGGDPTHINPLSPVDLVIDHSVQVDNYGTADAFSKNVELEMQRNRERYEFLRWGQKAFQNFRVVPPGTGICHQVNLEYLARVVWTKDQDGITTAYPDTVVGTDSHTTMINGLAVLGWGVGGIEAEAAMLGQPVSMVIPEVIGFELIGKAAPGVTATDIVLTVTQMLRKKGVVGKFVEFYGEGLNQLQLADRATIANMAPEYGATCGFFPVDAETIRFLHLTNRDEAQIALVEAYAKAQGLWRNAGQATPVFTDTLKLDLASVEPCIAGPKRPQDRVVLAAAKDSFIGALPELAAGANIAQERNAEVAGQSYKMAHGDIAVASITSCTNTSNPSVLIAAGLLARNAVSKGLQPKPWVKTSLAPGSQVVTEYLASCGLDKSLDALGFQLVGYGCTTCIGNSGPLKPEIEESIQKNQLVMASVLSGNRNFEGRIHPLVKANYLASPPLVVAYAIAGSMLVNLATEPLGQDSSGAPVYLKDIWPSDAEIAEAMAKHVTRDLFKRKYAEVFTGTPAWQQMKVSEGVNYAWDAKSTYIANPPYFSTMGPNPGQKIASIQGARLLALFADSITTDHISPAGNIAKNSPAATYLLANNVAPADFNSYGARRGNHEVMMRGTFANIRIKNELLPGTEGGMTKLYPSGEVMSIYDAAMRYQAVGTPTVVVAGKEYGTGSSRDWAAKGPFLLGVKAVVAESFERIHRSNLVGMGILPLVLQNGMTRADLKLTGQEAIDIILPDHVKPRMQATMRITYADNSTQEIMLLCRIDTQEEIEYILHGGILHKVIRDVRG